MRHPGRLRGPDAVFNLPGFSIWPRKRRPHLRFTALIIDCEGCLTQFMRDEGEFLREPSLECILYETDERNQTLCPFGFASSPTSSTA